MRCGQGLGVSTASIWEDDSRRIAGDERRLIGRDRGAERRAVVLGIQADAVQPTRLHLARRKVRDPPARRQLGDVILMAFLSFG